MGGTSGPASLRRRPFLLFAAVLRKTVKKLHQIDLQLGDH